MSRRPIGLVPGASEAAAGQDERKYSSKNPVVRRLLERWIAKLAALAAAHTGTVLDVGVGEALALERVAPPTNRLVGVEYRDDKLRAAVGRMPTLHGVRADAGMLPVSDGAADLVLCTEVLEHLVRPDDAIAELARMTADTCLVSVPWEPWFRLGNL